MELQKENKSWIYRFSFTEAGGWLIIQAKKNAGENKGGGLSMLDLFFGEKLFDRVMSNPKIRNKFWGYFWRAALVIAGSMAVVFLLVFALAAFMQGGLTLSGPMILILIAAILIVSLVTPIVQYFLWRGGRKK